MSVGCMCEKMERESVRVCACARVRVCTCARMRVCVWAWARACACELTYTYTQTRLHDHGCKYVSYIQNGFTIPHLLPLPHYPHATPPSNQCHAAEMAFQKRNSARARVMRTQNDGDAEVILRLSRAGRDGITNSSSKGCAPSEASSAHTNLRISMSPGPPPTPPTPLPAPPTPPPVPSLLLLRMPLTAERRGRAVS